MASPWNPEHWKRDLGRAVSGALGSLIALMAAGWPDDAALAAWIGIGGLIVGIAVGFAAEYVLRLRSEVSRLQGVETELELERETRARERDLLKYELLVANRTAQVSEVNTSVWGGAFNEAVRTGHLLPLEAIMARIEVEQKAKGLDKPLPPPPVH